MIRPATKPRTFSFTNARNLLEKIDAADKRHRLFFRGDRLVAAASGGPDSTALLALFSILARKHGWTVTVAHLDHGLSAHATVYRNLAAKTAARFGFSFISKKVDVRAVSKRTGRSIEEAGRIERYRFFEETAKKVSADKVVTAHTLDDQAETMLMRILRGSGWRGLSGIPYKRPLGKFEVIRPLLLVPKNEIEAFLKANRIPFVSDPTNSEDIFTRNRVRSKLLPAIEKDFNPRIREALSNLQAVSAEAGEFLDQTASAAFKKCLVRRGRGRVVLSAGRLNRLHPAVRSAALFKAVESLKGHFKGIDYHHLTGLSAVLASKSGASETHLPGGLRAVKKNDRLELVLGRD